jgi:hypothetical protein
MSRAAAGAVSMSCALHPPVAAITAVQTIIRTLFKSRPFPKRFVRMHIGLSAPVSRAARQFFPHLWPRRNNGG